MSKLLAIVHRFRGLLSVGGGLAARSLFAALAGLMAARFLAPESYGQAIYLITLIALVSALSEPGLRLVCGRAVARQLKAGSFGEARLTTGRYLAVRLLLALPITSMLLFYLLSTDGSGAEGLKGHSLWILVLVVPLVLLGQHAQAMAEMSSAFARTGFILASASLLRAFFVISMVITGYLSVPWLVAAEGLFGLLLVLLLQTIGNPIPGGWRPVLSGGWGLIKEGGWFGLATVLGLLVSRTDVLILGEFSDAKQMGLYGAALGLALKGELLKNSVLTVYYPKVSASVGSELQAHLRGMGRIVFWATWLLPPFLVVGVIALRWGAGADYASALLPFAFLTASVFVQLVVEPRALLLYVHRPKQIALSELALLLFVVSLAPFGAELSGASGVAAVVVLCRSTIGLLKLYLSRRVAV